MQAKKGEKAETANKQNKTEKQRPKASWQGKTGSADIEMYFCTAAS